jgi:hypothetical protein
MAHHLRSDTALQYVLSAQSMAMRELGARQKKTGFSFPT